MFFQRKKRRAHIKVTAVLGTTLAFKGVFVCIRFRDTSAFPMLSPLSEVFIEHKLKTGLKHRVFVPKLQVAVEAFSVFLLTVGISLSFKRTLISVYLCLYHVFTREAAVSSLSGVWECEEETRWGSRLMKGLHFPHRHAHTHRNKKKIKKRKQELLQLV